MPGYIQKGEHAELLVTQEARHRVTCGLSWDPMKTGPALGERLKGLQGHNIKSYDLDLICVMYDAEGTFVDGVSGKPDETIDDSGHVYHTGDDTSGVGDDDDEQVSIELKDLPDYIHHIFFVAEIQCAHSFGDIINPEMRITDAMTHQDLIKEPLGHSTGSGNSACVFMHLYRGDGQWMMHYIDDYMDISDVADWTEQLKSYISV
jgi:tellurium resistance protein TerD